MPESVPRLSWPKKFAVAFSGLFWAFRTESSFWVHLPVAIAVLSVAVVLRVELWRWVALVLTITIVIAVELLNSAIEQMIKVLHPESDERIGHVLDMSAAAVLIAAIGATAVGLLTLGPPIWSAVTATFG